MLVEWGSRPLAVRINTCSSGRASFSDRFLFCTLRRRGKLSLLMGCINLVAGWPWVCVCLACAASSQNGGHYIYIYIYIYIVWLSTSCSLSRDGYIPAFVMAVHWPTFTDDQPHTQVGMRTISASWKLDIISRLFTQEWQKLEFESRFIASLFSISLCNNPAKLNVP